MIHNSSRYSFISTGVSERAERESDHANRTRHAETLTQIRNHSYSRSAPSFYASALISSSLEMLATAHPFPVS